MSNHRPIWTDSGPDICVVDDETWPCAFMQDAARADAPSVGQQAGLSADEAVRAFDFHVRDLRAVLAASPAPEPTPGLREAAEKVAAKGYVKQADRTLFYDLLPEMDFISGPDFDIDERALARWVAALAASPAPYRCPDCGTDDPHDHAAPCTRGLTEPKPASTAPEPPYPEPAIGYEAFERMIAEGLAEPLPAPEPTGLDVERLIVALRNVDERVAAADPENAVELLSAEAEVGRRDYAVVLAAEYARLTDSGATDGET